MNRKQPMLFIGKKKPQFYKGLSIKADLGLHDQLAQQVSQRLPRGAKLLDLGAGEGALSERLADLGFDVIAVDMDEKNFKSKNAKFFPINFDRPEELQNFCNQFAEKFDGVLGIEVIEHLENPFEYVRQIHRLVKPNGLVILTTPNTASWLSRMIFLFRGRLHQFEPEDLSYGHITPITPWMLEEMLRRTGLKNIQTQPAGTLPPIYICGINTILIMNALSLLLWPFMKGIKTGWCLLITAQKA